MNKNDIQNIVIIAEEGSLSKASKRLFVSQPALSKCLQKVESELGEKIFVRTPTGLSTTYAGSYFLKNAYKILKLYNDMEIEFCDINNMRKGTLKLGCAVRQGSLVLPKILPEYSRRYPNISVNLFEFNSQRLEEKLIEGIIDIALLWMPVKSESLEYTKFFEEGLLVAVPKGHELTEKTYFKEGIERPYIDIQLLKKYGFVLTHKHKKTRQAADEILKHIDGEVSVVLLTQSIETVIGLVANGMGISIIPETYSEIYYPDREILYFNIEEKYSPYWAMGIAYNKEMPLTRPAREFFNMLIEK